jgi:hypothetical protein
MGRIPALVAKPMKKRNSTRWARAGWVVSSPPRASRIAEKRKEPDLVHRMSAAAIIPKVAAWLTTKYLKPARWFARTSRSKVTRKKDANVMSSQNTRKKTKSPVATTPTIPAKSSCSRG